jgi:hypothetical protein
MVQTNRTSGKLGFPTASEPFCIYVISASFGREQREPWTAQNVKANKQTPWPLVRQRTIPTERPPIVDEI